MPLCHQVTKKNPTVLRPSCSIDEYIVKCVLLRGLEHLLILLVRAYREMR